MGGGRLDAVSELDVLEEHGVGNATIGRSKSCTGLITEQAKVSSAAGLNGLPYIGGDGARRFRVNAPTEEGAQGISWDNDFNRALWCWTYQQWQASRAARGLPSMRSAHRGRIGRNAIAAVPFLIPFLPFTIGSAIYEAQQEMNDPEIRAWWGVLDAIELCELQQRVNLPALQMACCLVADALRDVGATEEGEACT